MDQRRRAVAGALLAAALVVVGAVGALTTGSTSEAGVGGPVPPETLRVEVDDGGIAFLVRTSFPATVVLSRPRAHVGDTQTRAFLLPDGMRRYSNRPYRRVELPAGRGVALIGILVPRCAGEGGDVSFTVRARVAGEAAVTRRVGAANPWLLRQAVNDYCHRPPTVLVSGCRLAPDGQAEIHLLVRNHGPDELSVEIPAYDGPGVAWEAVSTYVRVGENADIVVRGTQVDEGDPMSWDDGRLLLDGEPFVVRSDDAFCG